MGSILYTDGYPSYPSVSQHLSLRHQIINHSEGFRAVDTTQTNNIEEFWAQLKTEMREQHGVSRKEIDEWIHEYCFRTRFLANYDSYTV